jgi:hypothetical protein
MVGRLPLAVDAIGVDVEQDGDTMAEAAGHLGDGDARVEP